MVRKMVGNAQLTTALFDCHSALYDNFTGTNYIVVASAGIEPASGASEALILSIVLRGRSSYSFMERGGVRLFYQFWCIGRKYFYGNGEQYYAKKFSYSS